jgi:hypothetical protein
MFALAIEEVIKEEHDKGRLPQMIGVQRLRNQLIYMAYMQLTATSCTAAPVLLLPSQLGL